MRVATVGGLAVASFWFAIMLQLLFSMELEWLPLRGRIGVNIGAPPGVTGFFLIDSLLAGRWDQFTSSLRHIALPAITLAVPALATIARFARVGVLDTLQRDFVLYETAVGYPRRRIVWIYVLRNSVITAVTQVGNGSEATRAACFSNRAVNQNVDPAPTTLRKPISPPISSTSRLEIARPRPVPPYLRVVDPSACVNA